MMIKRVLQCKTPLLALSLLLLMLGAGGCGNNRPNSMIDSTELKNTLVAAYLEQPMAPGKNIVYCASFQFAWNELRDKVLREPVRIAGGSDLATFLNKSTVNAATVGNDDGFMSLAGFGRDGIVNRINQVLDEKYRGAVAPVSDILPHEILAYACFMKELEFRNPFQAIKKEPLYFQGRTRVKAFGIDEYVYSNKAHGSILAQVTRLSLRPDTENDDPDEFAIRIATTSPEDELILAMLAPRDTLLATVESVEKRREPREMPLSLNADQNLAIPDVAFNIQHAFSELEGATLENDVAKAAESTILAECRQDMCFSLNRKGVKLKSTARILATLGIMPSSCRFDRPFLLYLKKKAATLPYFAAWIADPELLIKEAK